MLDTISTLFYTYSSLVIMLEILKEKIKHAHKSLISTTYEGFTFMTKINLSLNHKTF